MVVLVIQLLSGIWLLMNYEPTAEGAFASIQYIMRDVEYGYIIRYMHTTGASAFFALIYLHMFRGMMYGSYQKPRELLWVVGWITYLLLCMLGFTGYVLPWGQMSFWAAQVIMSLFGSIPYIGEDLLIWIRGDYLISGITLNRLFALHVVLLPLALIAVIFVSKEACSSVSRIFGLIKTMRLVFTFVVFLLLNKFPNNGIFPNTGTL